jgi:hypothetical protein
MRESRGDAPPWDSITEKSSAIAILLACIVSIDFVEISVDHWRCKPLDLVTGLPNAENTMPAAAFDCLQTVADLRDQVRNIDQREWVRATNFQLSARRQGLEGFACPQRGQRTLQP